MIFPDALVNCKYTGIIENLFWYNVILISIINEGGYDLFV